MARGTEGVATHDLETLLRHGAVGSRSDTELLDRFIAARGEEAEASFAALVQRHGPMVQGVCRRILGNPDDADDAFQATFLVLARKARAIARRELLANWLYGVAVRTARELKAQQARRLAREGKMNRLGTPAAASIPDDSLDELRTALDEELSRLSGLFRRPVVLIDLQGKTHQEAARILGLPVGTVSSRLVRGREKLRKRLLRRGLSLSAGTIAAFCAGEASARSVAPLLVAATSRAAVQCLAGAVAATLVSGSVASLSNGVLKSLWISTLPSKVVVMGLVLAASVGAGVGVLRLSAQGSAPPFERTVPDDWSWVDALPNADSPTKERLKRCARSALQNYAALHRLVYDFDLTREFFFNDGKNHFTFKTYPYKGKLYWNEGAVRYDFEGESVGPLDKAGNPVPHPKGTYSVLRTRDMVAQIQDHEVYGVVLKVDPPPKSLDAWQNGHRLDPWVHYAPCFRFEPRTLKELWSSQRLIESQEDSNTITLSFTYAKTPGWMEIICGRSCDSLPVHWKYGDVQKGKKLTWGEETSEWKKTDGVWYPAHYEKTAFIGVEMRPTKEYDLRVSNLRANTAAKIPAAVFTLSDLPFPDGYGGLDNRTQPPGHLIRTNGMVRESRPGERTKDSDSDPVPYPKLSDLGNRVEKEDYLALVSEYAAKRRSVDDAGMKARTETELSAVLENMRRLESAYAGRFLAMAAKHAGDRVGFDALATVAVNQFTPRESMQAVEILIRDHLSDREMGRVIAELGSPHLAFSQAGEKLLRAGVEGAPTRQGKARACLRLARHLRWRARTLRQLRRPSPDTFIALSVQAAAGDVLKNARPDTPELFDKEAERLYARIVDQFGDVPLGSETMGDDARRELFKLRDLALGKPAPEVEGPDVDGKPMKLSDYRGKVVLLTFAGSWCRDRDYPVYRELVERMKGRPFALLCVNVDDSRETLLDSIKNGEITWRCWWEGKESGLNRQSWRVNELPSVFVIDAQGIIRAKEIEGKALVARVDELVRECERGGKIPGK